MSKIGEIIIVQCLDKIALLLEPSWWQIFAAISTPLIALMVAYVAYRQYKLDEARLWKETYPEKIKIYKNIISFLSEIIRTSATDDKKITEFYKEVSEANFLFGKEPNDKIEEIYGKAFDLWELETMFQTYQSSTEARTESQNKDYAEILKKRSELKKWFIRQPEITAKIFKKELSLIKEGVWDKVFK